MTLFASEVHINPQFTFKANQLSGRFGWLRLTPAYSHKIVQSILDACNDTDKRFILDPFCGTGTTPLVASLSAIPAHVVEINPFLCWFTKCKLKNYTQNDVIFFENAANHIATLWQKLSTGQDHWVPPLFQIEKWWDNTTLGCLARLFHKIQSEQNTTIKNLLVIAFCRTMIQCSRASFGHQSMSFKKSSPTWFDTDEQVSEQITNLFVVNCRFVMHEIIAQNPLAETTVFQGDSRNVSQVLPRNDYSLVITSPPYPNRMSYIRELRPYMYWTSFLCDGHAAGEMDWETIGGTWGCATSLLNTWTPNTDVFEKNEDFLNTIRSVETKHLLLSRYIHKYFCDVKMHIKNMKKVLRKNAKCFYIVGNTKFYDTLIPVERYYQQIFIEEGFRDVQVLPIRKRTSKKELYEYSVYAQYTQ